MNPFTDLLKKYSNKINLPQPKKARILLEIAADLNDTYSYYLQKGDNEQEAYRKACEKFELSDEVINDLNKVHMTNFYQWVLNTLGFSQTLFERLIFGLVGISVMIIVLYTALTTTFFINVSVYTYLIFAILIAVTILSLFKIHQLYIKKDHNISSINSGMSLFNILLIANVFVGMFGYFTELYFAGTNMLYLGPFFLITMVDVNLLQDPILGFMIRTSLLIMVCMFTTLIIGMFWLLITNKISSIEQAEAEILLAE
ncbi:MAG: hypothetical protein P8Y99_02610 [Calditrichaceae bacterium]|jgi:hypothetical protein